VVSSVSQRAFDAIREGAVDFISKPAAGTGGLASLARELILKVKIASTAKVGPATRPALPRPSPSVDPQGDPVAAKLRLRLQELMQEK